MEEEGTTVADKGGRSAVIPFSLKEHGRVVAAGVAAALVLLLFGWRVSQVPRQAVRVEVMWLAPAAPDPLVGRLVERDLGLAEADTPRRRVEGLAAMADNLHEQTRPLVGVVGVGDLLEAARWYKQLVLDGVVEQAKSLPAAERRPVLDPIGDRLARVRRDAEKLARAVPAAALPLQVIASAAREGTEQLEWTGKVVLTEIDFPPAQAADAGRAGQWQRNRFLVQTLVEGGLRLAAAAGPVKRADCSNDLADTLGDQIRLAVVRQEGAWAGELGRYFQAFLTRGVAGNLRAALGQAPAGSGQEREVRRLGQRAAEVAGPVKEQLVQAVDSDPENLGLALRAVEGGWAEVEKALQEKGAAGQPG